jgi:hypothetical protein
MSESESESENRVQDITLREVEGEESFQVDTFRQQEVLRDVWYSRR